jgi:hypothetical protein
MAKVLSAILALLLLIWVFWVGNNAVRIFCLTSVDTSWLIETGRHILATGKIPAADIYSFTNPGKPWVVYQWLFEVILAGLHRLGGLNAIQAFVALLSFLLFSVIAARSMLRRGVNIWITVFVCLCASSACLSFLTARPQTISMVFFYAVARLLESVWEKPGPRVLWLLPIFLLWANIHLIFPIALGMVAVYAVCACARWTSTDAVFRHVRRKWLFIGLGGSALMSLINPFGWRIYEYGLITSSSGFWKGTIGEVMAPQFDDPVGTLILNYICLSIISFMLSNRKATLPEGINYVLLLSAGLASWKILPYLVVTSMEPTALRVQEWVSRIKLPTPKILMQTAQTLKQWALSPYEPVLLLCGCLWLGFTSPVLLPPWYPVEAADYIAAHRPPGPMFTAAKFGSYLIYRFRGTLPVFIDTRFDMYGPEFSDAYFVAHNQGVGFNDFVSKYNLRSAFVETDSGIARLLWASPQWESVYGDGKGIIFVRRDSGS